MGIEAAFGDVDPLKWAKRPRSQTALDLLTAGAKEGDSRLADILAGHVLDMVCSESGKLLQRWDGLAWRRADESEYRRAA
jgi:hypothetical protein